jgi:hypothetical protein
MKVDYRTTSGHLSTAYLDEPYGETAQGVDKHSDTPLTLRWTGTEWQETEES